MQKQILKIAVLATGFCGLVAEYTLSTLASYFLGDSTFQWAIIISLMLFAMGLGARFTQLIRTSHLLTWFISLEYSLSLLVAYSTSSIYFAALFPLYTPLFIYLLSLCIGLLIGMEIPLVVRLNEQYEPLQINISSVLENDYYGALLGGLFFSFVALPYLSFSSTPFFLGMINFSVAVALFLLLEKQIPPRSKKIYRGTSVIVFILLLFSSHITREIAFYSEQSRYTDKIIFSQQTRYQKIVITQFREHYWLYLNGHQQFSSLDEAMYHEPLVHPAMLLSRNPKQVLICGGGDGCAAREVLKYPKVESVTLVDLDPAMTHVAQTFPPLTRINRNALSDSRTLVKNDDAFHFIDTTQNFYDVIIADFPDPRDVGQARLYAKEFFSLVKKRLRPNGIFISQAGSPYTAPEAFHCIKKTIKEAGFHVLPLHNHVTTMGEWGFLLASVERTPKELKQELHSATITPPTRWLNKEAMFLITSFGKNIFSLSDTAFIDVNTLRNPILFRYYNNGLWETH